MLTSIALSQILVYFLSILIFVKPLGWYMAKVYSGPPSFIHRFGRPVEQSIYRLCGIRSEQMMDWKMYLVSMLMFNLLGLIALYLIQRLQLILPLNPQHFPAPSHALAWNTAVSFTTNTDWQVQAGESTLSYLTQMLGLTTQNFLSAATGMCLMAALARGIAAREGGALGNFWVDAVRGILYILLPISMLFACFLVSQGVIQNFKPYQHVTLLQSLNKSTPAENSTPHLAEQESKSLPNDDYIHLQTVPMGPVASQEAIKQLGTNGGGFFNANAAHPFENPTPLTNFFEMVALLLIPAALCYTFGLMVGDKRQGWVLLAAMFILYIPSVFVVVISEQVGNPRLNTIGIDQHVNPPYTPGGNMEGKETRFGIVSSALWAVSTTASANGSVNSALDSYTPLGALIVLWMMQLGEVVFGGAGTGVNGMLMLVFITVFVSGLMVGRTPEFMGKKIEPFEMKMASIAVLVMPLIVLLTTAVASVIPAGRDAMGNPGAHGFTEMLYAWTSMANNNGSAFAGIDTNTPFYQIVGGFLMLIGRYWIAIPMLAIAGSLVRKKVIPETSGTLGTSSALFIVLLVSVIVLVGALAFLPALALGPIVEHLSLWGRT